MEVKSVLLLILIATFQIFCYSYFSDNSNSNRFQKDSTSIAFGPLTIASKDDIRKIRSLDADGEINRLTISPADKNSNDSDFIVNTTSESESTTSLSSSTLFLYENAPDVNLSDSKLSDDSTIKKIEETNTEKPILNQSSENGIENAISTSPTSYPLETSSLIVNGKEIDNNITMERIDNGQTSKVTTVAVDANSSFVLDVETTTTKNSKSNTDSQLNNIDYNVTKPNMEPSAFRSESARITNETETSTQRSGETSTEPTRTDKVEFESETEQASTSLDTMKHETTISSDDESISNFVAENSTTTVQSISRSITDQTTTMTDTWQTVDPITSEVTEDVTTKVRPITKPVTEQLSTEYNTQTTMDPTTSALTQKVSTETYIQTTVDSFTSSVTEGATVTIQPTTNSVTEQVTTKFYTVTTAKPTTNPVTEQPSTEYYTKTTVNPITSLVTENATMTVQSTTKPVTEQVTTKSYTLTTAKPTTKFVTEQSSTVNPTTSSATENPSTEYNTQTTVNPTTSLMTENATVTVQPTTNSVTEQVTTKSYTATTAKPTTTFVTEQSTTKATSESIQPVTTTTIRSSTSQVITQSSVTDFTTKESVSTTDRETTPFYHSTLPPENETDSHIDQECDCRDGNLVLPQCKEICALSTILSGFHINLTFFGLKISMILSNRDYLICIGVFLGITLVLVGFVARMVQRRKRRRMIAQRNFEILYQDFGVQSEKTKKWLADFNYQSSIL